MTFLFGGPIPLPPQTGNVGSDWIVGGAALILLTIVVLMALVQGTHAKDKPVAKGTKVHDLRKAA
jgi:hypothetical protein